MIRLGKGKGRDYEQRHIIENESHSRRSLKSMDIEKKVYNGKKILNMDLTL